MTRDAPVSLFVTVTVAFWMTAPDGSVTVPAMVPVGTCAMTGMVVLAANVSKATISSESLDFLCMLFSFPNTVSGVLSSPGSFSVSGAK